VFSVLNVEHTYSLKPLSRGYNNRTLYINLTDNKIISKTVTEEMKEIFVGGRGFDLWLLWNALPKAGLSGSEVAKRPVI